MTDRTAIREEVAESLDMLADEFVGDTLYSVAAKFRKVAEKLTHKKTDREIAVDIARKAYRDPSNSEHELASAIEAALAKKGAGE